MNATPEGHVDQMANLHTDDLASVPLSERPLTPPNEYKATGYWSDGRWT